MEIIVAISFSMMGILLLVVAPMNREVQFVRVARKKLGQAKRN